jgi:hypothetical protein
MEEPDCTGAFKIIIIDRLDHFVLLTSDKVSNTTLETKASNGT